MSKYLTLVQKVGDNSLKNLSFFRSVKPKMRVAYATLIFGFTERKNDKFLSELSPTFWTNVKYLDTK